MQKFFNSIKSSFGLFFTACLLFGCTKGGDLISTDGVVYIVTGNANSQQMIPVGTSTGTSIFNGWYDEGLQILTISLAYTDLWTNGLDEITAIKFYGPASTGEDGTLIRTINFSAKGAVGTGTANVGIGTISTEEKSDIISGKWYYIISTKNNPNGIIRGQLKAVKY